LATNVACPAAALAALIGRVELLLRGREVITQHARRVLRIRIITLLVRLLLPARVIIQSVVDKILHLLEHLASGVVGPTATSWLTG